MAVLPIQITGEPVLHTPASPVTEFDDGLTALISDMFQTMAAAPGVGLAAPQVGVPLRLFVYNWEDDDEVLWRGVAINPEIWVSPMRLGPLDEDTESEGCLSIPGERFPIRRAELAMLRAQDINQNWFEIKAEGWLARIFQHEFDHLDGLLYVDRLEFAESKAASKVIRKSGWGVPGLSWLPGVDHPEG